jgi:putative DNA primase/helicase
MSDLPPILDAQAPTLSAQTFHDHHSGRIIHWRGDYYVWVGTLYERRSTDEIKAAIYAFGNTAVTESGGAFKPNIRKVDEIAAALKFAVLVPDRFEPFADLRHGKVPPGQVISCQNGLLDVDGGTLSPHRDDLLILNTLPFAYDAAAPEPTHWLRFVKSLWPNDDGKEGGMIATLQEMIGYLVSGRTDMQKIFLLFGPTRSGKGTIAHIIEQLIGSQNYVGVTLGELCKNFGTAGLIGKTVLMIPDARPVYTPNLSSVTEMILSISGEDVLSVSRKYQTAWTGKLPTRIVITSNEMPRLHDASGVIAGRFLPIEMKESFFGREDADLLPRLYTELPQILRWAIEGSRRLNQRGRFIVPDASLALIDEVADAASPHLAFIRERLIRDPDCSVDKQKLYDRYRGWCADNGHQPCAANTFGRHLKTAIPWLKEHKPHGQPRQWFGIWWRRDDDDSPSPLDAPRPPMAAVPDRRFEQVFS